VKLTFIWQSASYQERDWINEILRPIAGHQIVDGQHRVVLDNCLLIDSYPYWRPRDYYESFRGKNAWLLHLGDETYEGGYDRYDYFRGVLRSYWSKIFNPRRVLQIPLGYSAGTGPATGQLCARQRAYLWSFVGAAAKSSRPEMIGALSPITPNFVHTTDDPNTRRMSKNEYQEILRQSVFAPSAMGNVNLECFRPYEALECGSVPILEKRIGLDYFANILGKHPIPSFKTWGEARQFLAQLRWDDEAQDHLIAECTDWWRSYKRDLSARIERFIEQPDRAEAGTAVWWQQSIPGSRAIELLRHHTVPAVIRRIKRQVVRIVKEAKFRKTAGR
jgi:hypothetical protein